MNLPNKITVFRMGVVPFFLFFYLTQAVGYPAGRWIAFALFVIASVSDAVDGHIARRRHLVTNFGKLMDPLADKILVSAALFAMVETGVLPAWVAVILVSREFLISGWRQLALEQNIVLAASFWAKMKTATQMVMVLFLLLPGITGVAGYEVIKWVLMGASVVFSVVSAVEYIVKNKKVLGHL